MSTTSPISGKTVQRAFSSASGRTHIATRADAPNGPHSSDAHTNPREMTRAAPRAPISKPPAFDVVAIGASAGGVQALREILVSLPKDFPAGMIVVLHWPPKEPLTLPGLARLSAVPLNLAANGREPAPGILFLAPPDQHLLVRPNGSFLLSRSPRIHWVRPSVDLLFESTAAAYGTRAIAVILSGSGRDGSIGVKSIKTAGGTVIAQDQATAQVFRMPEAAIQTGCVDLVLAPHDITPALIKLVTEHEHH